MSYLVDIHSPVEIDAYIGEIYERTGIGRDTLQ